MIWPNCSAVSQMQPEYRWDLAVTNRKENSRKFISEYFNDAERQVLLIAGAGFDPRATILAEQLGSLEFLQLRAAFIKETRSESDARLQQLASENLATLAEAIPNHEILAVDIFGADNSVTAGRSAARALHKFGLGDATDVIVDISALSVGVSFPMIRWVLDTAIASDNGLNVHIFVSHEPELDSRIRSVPAETPVAVHGFDGGMSLSAQGPKAARLWMPQLATGRTGALRRIHDKVTPDEVCVILPFPAAQTRHGDSLLEELLEPDDVPWDMDSRSIVYADEADPLDLYRTIMRLHALREPVFAETGGSQLILSPVGSKVMALGALLAALELDLPVIYLEDFSYELLDDGDSVGPAPDLMHVWLEGDPYTSNRPSVKRKAAL